MQINNISMNNISANNNPSFGQVTIVDKQQILRKINNAKGIEKYIKHADSLEGLKINLKELTKSMRLSRTDKFVLKNYFLLLGEKDTTDFPIEITNNTWNDICQIRFSSPSELRDGKVLKVVTRQDYLNYVPIKDKNRYSESILKMLYSNLKTSIGYHLGYRPHIINQDIDKKIMGKIKSYSRNYEGLSANLPTPKTLIKTLKIALKYHIKEVSSQIDTKLKKAEEEEKIKAALNRYSPDTRYDYEYNELPVSSLICTLDDITGYLDKHDWHYGEIFNKPITKDGETLLMALAHVKPDEHNIEKYTELIEKMKEMSWIDYNQKDSLGIPFIDHVLNSENMLLLTAASFCDVLRYTPELDSAFDNIKNSKFKEMVLNLDLFNNIYNIKYKKIFHQPNPA